MNRAMNNHEPGSSPEKLSKYTHDTTVGITPEQVRDAMRTTAARGSRMACNFPLDALPSKLTDYAQELHRVERFPLDYIGAGMLFAASSAIGNAVHLRVREGYHAPPMLWLVLVGPPSVGKTHPLNRMCKPLAKRDARNKLEHDRAIREWEAGEEERRKRGKDATADGPPLAKPLFRPHLVDDITREALVAKLAVILRGVGLHCDELAGWLARFDQYRKGGDRQAWLSIFNGSQLTEFRKNAGEHVVQYPFVAVGGGVQPGLLKVLGREHDGLIHRLLFAYPDEPRRNYASPDSIDPRWSAMWDEVVDTLLALPMQPDGAGNLEPRLVAHSIESAQAYANWDRMNTDRTNAAIAEGDELIAALYGKLDTYAHRLALVLEMLHRACGAGGSQDVVRVEAMQGAIKLLDYFEATARKAHFELFEADEFDRLPVNKQRVYAALPDEFATADARKVAAGLGMSESTLKRFLRERSLFSRSKQGKYQKK
jgi:hypothetical protein